MKRVLSILLVLLLAVTLLPAGALADGPAVVLSTQGLRVNGKNIDCERYNIDGSNYFQLRDLAYVLNGTGSQFSVGWDGASKCVTIATGAAYEPVGTEMQMSDYDKIDTAAPSNDKVIINGEDRGDLSVFKIGGHNYFKLKDLGEALGFKVDYDTPSRTMIIVTRAWSWPTQWLTVETIDNVDGAALSHSVLTYDEDGNLLTALWEGEDYSESWSKTYDELGREVAWTRDYVSYNEDGTFEEHSSRTTEYDIWGLRIRETYQAVGDVFTETNYTYDDDGNLLVEETTDNKGRSGYYYTYDDNGNEIKSVYASDDEVVSVTDYTLDADGNILRSQVTDADGTVTSFTESVYVNGRETERTYSIGDYVITSRFTYDERGNQISAESRNNYGTSVSRRIYDDEDRLVQEEYESEDFSNLRVYTFNEEGVMTKEEYSDSDGYYEVFIFNEMGLPIKYESDDGDGRHEQETYTYTAAGDPLTAVYTTDGMTRTTTYSYDQEAHKQSILTVTEHMAVG